MNSRLIVHYNNQPAYQIYFEDNYDNMTALITDLQIQGRKVMIVSDSNVSAIYLQQVKEKFMEFAFEVYDFVFPAGENSKNLNTVEQCYTALIEEHFDRNDVLVALGGGVTGDLTGYVAATYLRGIRFIQMPTSLLAMVDSSIGGKTGVDFRCYKNMVGAFHQPKAVYMNLSVLHTLPDKEFYAGMGEIIKHGLIKDEAYFFWLKEHATQILEKDLNILHKMIEHSCRIKREVVELDPLEHGERAFLNFGHTIGHAIEKLKNFELLHGECVAIGCVAASYLSYQMGDISEKDYDLVRDTIKLFQLPIKTTKLNAREVLEATKLDKKMDGKKIKFICLNQIGVARIDTSIGDEMILEAIKSVME